ncbi:putative ATPase domain protein [Leptomonas pyrrhocoris]|uniref:Putative ATPase domain protein n=1 Tax=Leptomonas pyrrhocoris TaxID=157538 RepID=A0A0N0DUJ2_LEPPY|nr:putative ATPase domain protein [Leptomonas pyrrhocoris]XP_015657452.1 putative ATPase domain protein [Leptomonas pyrrhocoris]KPA79012.1 putative ATPase domain protein [Leptomonas pyrrhocoris]KPA79013.1 putative ATPase domain protein [Leptomonas pyrrhocoris]|eukprot:XP_015657451.1 putative ATPase domain protein [Leptomonas pyrrhocoris]
MSIDGRLIADVQRLRRINGVPLFFLVSGSKGSGKSTSLKAFADGLAASSAVEECDSVSALLRRASDGEDGGEAFTVCRLTYLMMAEGVFQASKSLASAQQLRPFTVLVVDDVDILWMLCSANRILGHLQRLLDLGLSSPSCAVVASALSLDAVPSWLLGRKLPVVHPLRELTEAGMRRLLRTVPQPLFKTYGETVLSMQTLSTSRTMLLFNACMTLHSATKGAAPKELSALAKENSAFLHHRWPPTENTQGPSRHLYGLHDVRHRMHTLLSVFVAHNSADSGGKLMSALPSSTGVLLHGPSGCGKSSLAQQLAADFPAVPFFFVECTMLFSKYLGESEEQLREVYRRARTRAPAVVILEDIDVIAQSRGALTRADGGSGGGGSAGNLDVTKRMLAGLLCELDGVTDNSGVLTIGVTNAPRVLDAAVLRQGRLETILYVPPLTHVGAAEMCREFFQQFDGSEAMRTQCSEVVASQAVGCSAAALQYVLRKVFEQAVQQNGWARAERSCEGGLPLPRPDDLHGLLLEHCAVLTHVHPSPFE